MRKPIGLITAGLLMMSAGVGAYADATTFDYKDPKGVNAISFTLDSKVEPIVGYANGISGTISFDPKKPEATTGKITIDAKSITTPNDGMTKTLIKSEWLDIEKNPTVEFTFKQVKSAKAAGENTYDLEVVGEFLCKGVKKDLTINVRLNHIPNGVAQRFGKGEGDVLIARTEFKINRKDFGIKTDMDGTVVAEDIQIRASICGITKK